MKKSLYTFALFIFLSSLCAIGNGEEPDNRNNLKVVGIMYGSQPPQAIIEDTKTKNSLILKEGDLLGEVKIQKIYRDKVTMDYKGEIFDLFINPPTENDQSYQKSKVSGISAEVKKEIERLRSSDQSERKEAAWNLSKIRNYHSVEPLIAAIKDEDVDVREKVIYALGEIGDNRAAEPLLIALEDKNPNIRAEAATALGKIRDIRAVKPLINALSDTDYEVKKQASQALGNIGKPALESLITVLEDKKSDPADRKTYAIQALTSIGDVKAIGVLVSCLKDKDSDVRAEAAEVLGYIKDPSSVKPLISALQDKDERVRANVIEALGKMKIKDTAAVGPLILCLRAENAYGPVEAAKLLGELKDIRAVKPLISALRDESPLVRNSAAEALGELGDQRAIKPLIESLKDWESWPRYQAFNALSKLGWKPKTDEDNIHVLIAQTDTETREEKIKQLGENWNLTEKVLLADVESNNYRTIEYALCVFIAFGKEEIIPILIQKLNTKGNKTMAEAFLNCGHKELEDAAREWATRHGYTISTGPGHSPVSWGSWSR